MFVQVFQGQAADGAAIRRQFDQWAADLRPGADGFIGCTQGVTDDGRFIALAYFESPEAAGANSERPEQGEWWAATARHLEGDATFVDSTDADIRLAGPSTEAGFVQVMQGGPSDPAVVREVDARFESLATEHRPDVIGSLRAWHPDGRWTEAVFFTGEEAARAGESQEPPAEVADLMAQASDAWGEVEYFDLGDPWVVD